jgi:hypothetical protein
MRVCVSMSGLCQRDFDYILAHKHTHTLKNIYIYIAKYRLCEIRGRGECAEDDRR